MAAPTLIDLSNYSMLLKESTQSRAETPDGNVFFDTSAGLLELITKEELAQVDLGSGLEDNPLTNRVGAFIGAIYAFERLRRRSNEFLRQFDSYQAGTFKFAGAYELINGRKFSTVESSTGDDRTKLRGSGWLERTALGAVDKIYFGVRSLGNIEEDSQPYYQLADGGVPTDFQKDGPIDEAIDVTGAVTFLSNKVRTFGFNYDEKRLVDSGIAEMSGYSAGFAIGETPHLTTGNYELADVYGVGQKEPWLSMGLEKLETPQLEGGFNEADGNFTWILHNAAAGTLDECVAFLDALAQADEDIDDGLLTETFGKRVRTWYSYDAAGRVITRSGADALGLFIENIPTADRQRVRFIDDAGDLKTYPFMIEVRLVVGANAAADSNAWFHVWEKADYGTPDAVTVLDSQDQPMKGLVNSQSVITLEYDAGDGAVDIVVECEGDGIATQAKTEAAIDAIAPIVSVVCSPGLETNV